MSHFEYLSYEMKKPIKFYCNLNVVTVDSEDDFSKLFNDLDEIFRWFDDHRYHYDAVLALVNKLKAVGKMTESLKVFDAMGIIEIRSGSRAYLNDSVKKVFINPMKFLNIVHKIGIDEINQIRRLIEIPLAGLAAEKATEKDIEAIEDALKESKEHRYNIKEYLINELAFHEDIFKASGNRILEAMMTSIVYQQ